MVTRRSAAAPFGAIDKVANDPTVTIGARLQRLRHLRDQIDAHERRLLMQIGVDAAKEMMRLGIQPTGRTIGEALTEYDKTADEADPARRRATEGGEG